MDVYNRAPVAVQNLLTTAQGWRLRRVRFGKAYHEELATLRQRDYADAQALRELQNRTLREFVAYAYQHSPFYQRFYSAAAVSAVHDVADLAGLPVLDKTTLLANLPDVYTIAAKDALVGSTSGTSGQPINYRYLPSDTEKRMAYLDYFKETHGFRHLQMRRASFTSSKIIPANRPARSFWRDNAAMKQRIYSGFHCHEPNLAAYLRNLNAYAPHALDGYPSAMAALAGYATANKIAITFRPVAIFPTAEKLYPAQKEIIEEAFGAPVRDQYASSEGAPFITTCTQDRLHYCIDTGVIEEAADGTALVTGFATHGTPLIRYAIGDRIELSPVGQTCTCGQALPLVEQIGGRNQDFLYATDGHKVTAVYLSLVDETFGSRFHEMQFQQDHRQAVTVRIAAAAGPDAEVEAIVRKKLAYSLGADMGITIEWMDSIPRTAAGKLRYVINNVK